MAEETASDTVSRAAHERVQKENADLKAQLADLQSAVTDSGTYQRAFDAIAEINPEASAADVQWATTTVLPHVKGLEAEGIKAKLESDFSRLFDGLKPPEPAPAGDDDGSPPAVADTSPTPGFAAPNPSAEGAPVEATKFTPESPEWKQAQRDNDRAWFDKMDAEGRLLWRTAPPPIVQAGSGAATS